MANSLFIRKKPNYNLWADKSANSSHWLADRAIRLWDFTMSPNSLRCLVSGTLIQPNTAGWGGLGRGGLYVNAYFDPARRWYAPLGVGLGSSWTTVIWYYVAEGSEQAVACIQQSGSTMVDGYDTGGMFTVNVNGTAFAAIATLGLSSVRPVQEVLRAYTSAAHTRLSYSDARAAKNSGTGTPSAVTAQPVQSMNELRLGTRVGQANYTNAYYKMVAVFDRGVSTSELQELSGNPHLLVVPKKEVLYFDYGNAKSPPTVRKSRLLTTTGEKVRKSAPLAPALVRRPVNTQRGGVTSINRGSPLAQGMSYLVCAESEKNLADDSQIIYSGRSTLMDTPDGRGFRYGAALGSACAYSPNGNMPWTSFIYVSRDMVAFSTGTPMLFQTGLAPGSGGDKFICRDYSVGAYRFSAGLWNGSSNVWTSLSPSLEDGKPHTYVATCVDGYLYSYFDGVAIAPVLIGGTLPYGLTTRPYPMTTFGGFATGAGAILMNGFVQGRPWGAVEAMEFHRNPWQLVSCHTPRIYVGA